MKHWKIMLALVCLFLFAFSFIFIFREFSAIQLDDVNDQRYCPQKFLEESDALMIIPLRNNVSIADNMTWCENILALNKTLGMHGVFHNPSEFDTEHDESYVAKGINEFKKCFGYYPYLFEAPELRLSSKNKKMLESMNFSIRGPIYPIFHKVYHCVDYTQSSYLVKINKVIEVT